MPDINVALLSSIGSVVSSSFMNTFQSASSVVEKLGDAFYKTNIKISAADNLLKYKTRLDQLKSGQLLIGVSSAGLSLSIEETQKKFNQASASAHQYGINLGNAIGFQRTLGAESVKLAKKIDGVRKINIGMTQIGEGVSQLKTYSPKLTDKSNPMIASVDLAWTFEEEMSAVRAVTQASDEDFKKLTDTVRQLGQNTAFSTSEAASGMMLLGQAGFKTNEIVSVMPGLIDMAASSGVSLEESVDIAASSFRSFGLSASDMTRVSDVLVQTSLVSNSSLRDLGESIKYIDPMSKGLNFSIEETSAALGVLHERGIKGAQAGMVIEGLFSSLADSSSKGAETLNALGVETLDATGNLLPLGEIIQNLSSELVNIDGVSEKAGYLNDLFGEDVLSGRNVLFLPDSALKLRKFTTELNHCAGAAKRVAETRLDNASGSFKILSSVISDIGISLGSVLLPPLKLFFDFSSMILGGIGWALNVIPGLADVITGLAAGFIFMTTVLPILNTAVMIVRGSMMALNGAFEANPFGLIALAIGVVAMMIYNYWEPISGFFTDLWTGISNIASAIWTCIKPVISFGWTIFKIFTPAGWAMSIMIGLVQLVIRYWDQLSSAVMVCLDWGIWLLKWCSPIGLIIMLVMSLTNTIGASRETISSFCSGFYATFTILSDLLCDLFSKIFDFSPVELFFTLITNGIDGIYSTFAKVGELWNGFKSFFGFGSDTPTAETENQDGQSGKIEQALQSAQSSTPAAVVARSVGQSNPVNNNQTFSIIQRPGEDSEELARRIARIQKEQEESELRGGFSDYSYA